MASPIILISLHRFDKVPHSHRVGPQRWFDVDSAQIPIVLNLVLFLVLLLQLNLHSKGFLLRFVGNSWQNKHVFFVMRTILPSFGQIVLFIETGSLRTKTFDLVVSYQIFLFAFVAVLDSLKGQVRSNCRVGVCFFVEVEIV